MITLHRKMTPVQRKPRAPRLITKKQRKNASKLPTLDTVPDKGWSNSDIEQTYTK